MRKIDRRLDLCKGFGTADPEEAKALLEELK